MFLPLVIRDYFVWHYGRAWWELWGLWRNCLWFVAHFFSLPQLLRSWFAPFRRITEARGATWSGEDLAAYIIINILSRLVGALVRTVLLLLGGAGLCLTVVGGFVVYGLWLVAPILIVGLLFTGSSLLMLGVW